MASCLRTAWCSCTLCECIPCGPALRAISSVDCALCARGRSVPLLGSITLSVCTVAVGGVGRGKEGPGLAPSSEATHTRTMLSTLSPGRSREVASPWPVASAQDELLTPSSPRGFEVPFFSTFVPPLPLPSPHMLLFTDLLEQCAKIIIMFYVLKKPWLCVVGETKGEQTQLLALAVASESQSHQGRGEPSWGAHRGGGGFPLHKGGARCPGSRSSVGTEGIFLIEQEASLSHVLHVSPPHPTQTMADKPWLKTPDSPPEQSATRKACWHKGCFPNLGPDNQRSAWKRLCPWGCAGRWVPRIPTKCCAQGQGVPAGNACGFCCASRV